MDENNEIYKKTSKGEAVPQDINYIQYKHNRINFMFIVKNSISINFRGLQFATTRELVLFFNKCLERHVRNRFITTTCHFCIK